jgi:hypothetical protein
MLEDNKPNPESGHLPTLSEIFWNPTRLELRAWLYRNAPSLAELYEGAVRLIFETPLSGRIRFISHAVREIRNRLPDVISGIKSGERLDYKSRLDEIAKLWEGGGFSLDGSFQDTASSEQVSASSLPDISVPRQLFVQFADLIKDHNNTREKPIEAAIRLFEGCAPENQQLRDALRPRVLQWLDVTKWFMQKAHDSGTIDANCDESELRRKFELFENTLAALIRGFFVTLKELDEILENTNS